MSDPKTVRDFPQTLDDEAESELVGVTTRGTPMYYDSTDERLFPVVDEGDGLVPDFDGARDLSPGETIQAVIDEIGETVGWESLVDDEEN